MNKYIGPIFILTRRCQEISVSQMMQFLTAVILTALLYACASSPQESGEPQEFGYTDTATEPTVTEETQTSAPVAQPEPVMTTAATAVKTAPAPVKKKVQIAIRPDTPNSYTVKRGDTLWGIANLFLRDPWLWPEIWYFNSQIENPHLIYPGNILTLVYIDGQPRLQLMQDTAASQDADTAQQSDSHTVVTVLKPTEPSAVTPGGLKTLKLLPRIRNESLANAIPTVPIDSILAFLVKPQIITKEELEKAPYIVSSLDSHLVSSTGQIVYVRGLQNDDEVRYNVFRPGRIFRNPSNNEILGYEALLVSEGKLERFGDPSTLLLTRSKRETLNGDRILPAEKGEVNYNFVPHAPEVDVEGSIIAFIDAISHTAQNQVVVINLGQRDGIDVGSVLAIDQTGSTIRDNYSTNGQEKIKLPNVRAGLIMVFRSFDRVSYGLIMQSARTIHMHDTVRNPSPVADVLAD